MFRATCLATHYDSPSTNYGCTNISQVFPLSNGLVWLRNVAEIYRKSLQKLEPCSTYRNGFFNLSRNVVGRT